MMAKWLGAVVGAALVVGGAAAQAADGMVSYTIVDGDSIPQALTAQAGDPAEGAKVFKDRKLGNCLACHANPAMANEPFHGEVGPSLAGVADRYDAAQLRLIVVNAKEINPDTVMPAFYRVDGLNRVRKDLVGLPILTAQQVEDVVAYLGTIKE